MSGCLGLSNCFRSRSSFYSPTEAESQVIDGMANGKANSNAASPAKTEGHKVSGANTPTNIVSLFIKPQSSPSSISSSEKPSLWKKITYCFTTISGPIRKLFGTPKGKDTPWNGDIQGLKSEEAIKILAKEIQKEEIQKRRLLLKNDPQKIISTLSRENDGLEKIEVRALSRENDKNLQDKKEIIVSTLSRENDGLEKIIVGTLSRKDDGLLKIAPDGGSALNSIQKRTLDVILDITKMSDLTSEEGLMLTKTILELRDNKDDDCVSDKGYVSAEEDCASDDDELADAYRADPHWDGKHLEQMSLKEEIQNLISPKEILYR